MALAGRFICSVTGIDCLGGFHPSFDAIIDGLGYATPPIMSLLSVLDFLLHVLCACNMKSNQQNLGTIKYFKLCTFDSRSLSSRVQHKVQILCYTISRVQEFRQNQT